MLQDYASAGIECYHCYSVKQWWDFRCVYPASYQPRKLCTTHENACAKTYAWGEYNGEKRDVLLRHCTAVDSNCSVLQCHLRKEAFLYEIAAMNISSSDMTQPPNRSGPGIPDKLFSVKTCICQHDFCNTEGGHDFGEELPFKCGKSACNPLQYLILSLVAITAVVL